jgi:hypothetical protein
LTRLTFAMTKRIFAERGWNADEHAWKFENGWERTMQGSNVTGFREFVKASFAEVHEEPGYFREREPAIAGDELWATGHYIGDLQQSGFDTMRLRVQLYRQAGLSAGDDRDGGAGDSVCAFDGKARVADRRGVGHRDCAGYWVAPGFSTPWAM